MVRIVSIAWLGILVINNLVWYFQYSLMIFKLRGMVLIALLSPALWIWVGLASAVWYFPLGMLYVLWTRSKSFTQKEIALFVVLIPLLLMLLFNYLAPHLFPVKIGEDGRIFIRLIPFL